MLGTLGIFVLICFCNQISMSSGPTSPRWIISCSLASAGNWTRASSNRWVNDRRRFDDAWFAWCAVIVYRWCPPTACSTRRWRPCTPSFRGSAPASAGSYTRRSSGTLGRPAVDTSAWLELSHWAGLLRRAILNHVWLWRHEDEGVKRWRQGDWVTRRPKWGI